MEFYDGGCELCRNGALTGLWPPPDRIATNPNGPTFLHKCCYCGTYWDFTLRYAKPISIELAKVMYPEAKLSD